MYAYVGYVCVSIYLILECMHVFLRLSSGLTATWERHAQPLGSPDRTPSRPTRTNPESTSSRTTRHHRALPIYSEQLQQQQQSPSIQHIHRIIDIMQSNHSYPKYFYFIQFLITRTKRIIEF